LNSPQQARLYRSLGGALILLVVLADGLNLYANYRISRSLDAVETELKHFARRGCVRQASAHSKTNSNPQTTDQCLV